MAAARACMNAYRRTLRARPYRPSVLSPSRHTLLGQGLSTHEMAPSAGASARALWENQVGFGDRVKSTFNSLRADLKRGLEEEGYYVMRPVVGRTLCSNMRQEASDLFRSGVFYRSFSMRGDEVIEKHNVYAHELDGHEWETAPSLLTYTKDMLTSAPAMINQLFPRARISTRSYATKLAVSVGGGSSYPKHLDNTGLPDTRKVTLVYYMNEHWNERNGGQIRLYTRNGGYKDIQPESDTLLVFWSDQLVHEVLPSYDEAEAAHRYTLTLWLVTEDASTIGDPSHPLAPIRDEHFPPE